MSRRHHKSKNGRGVAAEIPTDWTGRIFSAARSSGKSQKMTDEDFRLMELVAQSLDTGTDKHVLRAIEDLEEAGLEDAAGMVAFWADDAASTIPVMTLSEGEMVDGSLELFLVPILLVLNGERAVPLRLPDEPGNDSPSPLDSCAASLRRHGLIGNEPSVAMLPWLYAYSDLPVTWSGQRSWLRQFVSAAGGQPFSLPQPRVVNAVGVHETALRFMLFAVVSSSLDDDDVGPLLNGGIVGALDGSPAEIDGDGASIDSRLPGWREAFGEMLLDGLPGVVSARVGVPAWWDDAISAGFNMRNLFEMINAVASDADKEFFLSVHADMGVYFTDGEMELRIGFTSGERFISGVVWAGRQNLENEIELAFNMLEYFGVSADRVRVLDGVHGDERCPDCGERYFPGAAADERHEHSDGDDAEDREHPWIH